jgi:hypothetical protein
MLALRDRRGAMSEVAVIGCGPAGLLAAHAVALEGHTPVVFSKEAIKSPNARATFLQAPIPDLTSQEPDSTVRIGTIGSAEGYAQKVYGDPSRRTSWSRYSQERERGAWALAPVYDDLWDLYQGSVREVEVTYGIASAIKEDHRLVINTAPLPSLCEGSCYFPRRDIWVLDWVPQMTERRLQGYENFMVYNGHWQYGWSRASRLFGVDATEFPHEVPGASKGIKVLPGRCDCHPGIVRTGRWGTWQPGVLVHNAFYTAQEAVRAMERLHAL